MNEPTDEYANYVDHPRFGRRPRVTGLNPKSRFFRGVTLHWHSPPKCRVPNTAIPADESRQINATVPVSYYFDVKRQCVDCERPFLFFAEEQKHWYEELGFGLDSNCVRCVPCRKLQQGVARKRHRYEELFHVPSKNDDELLEMADCCLALIEEGVFTSKQTPRVRMLLNQLGDSAAGETGAQLKELLARLGQIEAK